MRLQNSIFKYDMTLLQLYVKICYYLKDYLNIFETKIMFNGVVITILTLKHGNIFRNIKSYSWCTEDIDISFHNKSEKIDSTEDMSYMYICTKGTYESRYNNYMFENIYTTYIDMVKTIYKIDNTGFIVVSDDIDIVDKIIQETKEFYEYTNIGERHVFTIRDKTKVPEIYFQ